MGRLNDIIKMVVMLVNCVYCTLGLALIIVSTYILLQDFEQLDPDFYQRICMFGIVTGVMIFGLAMIGCCGVIYQTRREGKCSGRRLLATYEVLLIAIMVGQGYLAVDLLELSNSLDYVRSESRSEAIEYDSFETSLSSSFNEFFVVYQATGSEDYDWFVDMIRDDVKCDAVINPDYDEGAETDSLENLALKCDDGSGCVSQPIYNFCSDNEDGENVCPDNDIVDDDPTDGRDDPNKSCACTCPGDGGSDDAPNTCFTPYDMCRTEVVSWVLDYVEPFAEYMAVIAGFELFMIMLTCLLICYNPRDDINEMLRKAGTVQYVEAPTYSHGTQHPQPGRV